MYVKKAMFLSSLIIIIGLLLTGCISSKPARDIVVLIQWEYAMVRLSPDAWISKTDGVEIIYNGSTITPDEVQPGKWFVIKKTDPNAGIFVIVSESGKKTDVRLVKRGDNTCPYWATSLYSDGCATGEFTVHK